MKKIMKLAVLALALPVLAGCGGSSEPTETRTEEEIIQDYATEKLAAVGTIYNSFSQAEGVSKDQTLVGEANIDGYNFTISYKVTPLKTYTGTYCKVNGTTLVITVPNTDELPEGDTYAGYTLTGTIKFVKYDEGLVPPKGVTFTEKYYGKEFGSSSWKVRINATATLELSLAEVYTSYYTTKTLKDSNRVITYGIYAGSGCEDDAFTYCSSKRTVFFDDGEYSIGAFDSSWEALPDLEIGKVYKIVGIFDDYYGTLEITSPTFTEAPEHHCDEAVIKEIDNATWVDDTANKFNACRQIKVTAVVTYLEFTYGDTWEHGTTKCSVNFNITGAETSGKLKSEMYAYVHQYDKAESYNTWAESGLTDTSSGDIITVIGRQFWYSGFPTLYFSTLLSITPAD